MVEIKPSLPLIFVHLCYTVSLNIGAAVSLRFRYEPGLSRLQHAGVVIDERHYRHILGHPVFL